MSAVIAGCGGGSEPRNGDPATYANIDGLTSCTALQEAYDLSSDTAEQIQASDGDASIPESYMDAATDRMDELDC